MEEKGGGQAGELVKSQRKHFIALTWEYERKTLMNPETKEERQVCFWEWCQEVHQTLNNLDLLPVIGLLCPCHTKRCVVSLIYHADIAKLSITLLPLPIGLLTVHVQHWRLGSCIILSMKTFWAQSRWNWSVIPLDLLCTSNYLDQSTHNTLLHWFLWFFSSCRLSFYGLRI